MKKGDKLTKKIYTCFSDADYQRVMNTFQHVPNKKLSSYIRQRLLNQPVTFCYRNRTLDDFIDVAAGIQQELQRLSESSALSSSERAWLKEQIEWLHPFLVEIESYVSKIQHSKKLPPEPGIFGSEDKDR